MVGQTQELPDRIEWKSECATVPNEGKSRDVRGAIEVLIPRGAHRGRHETDLADRLDLTACLRSQIADRKSTQAGPETSLRMSLLKL